MTTTDLDPTLTDPTATEPSPTGPSSTEPSPTAPGILLVVAHFIAALRSRRSAAA